MACLPRPLPCLFILLAVLMPFPDRTAVTPVAHAEIIKAWTDEDGARGQSSHRNLIRGERTSCPLPFASPEPLDPPTTSAFAGIRQFRAGESFRENIAPDAEVRILWIGASFMHRYAAKTESAAVHAAVRFHTLLKPSRDTDVIEELGDMHETRLADLWCLLKSQANGEAGILLVNAVPNIFYVRDHTGILGAIDAVWGGAGWEIGASPADGDRQWPPGTRVLSRER